MKNKIVLITPAIEEIGAFLGAEEFANLDFERNFGHVRHYKRLKPPIPENLPGVSFRARLDARDVIKFPIYGIGACSNPFRYIAHKTRLLFDEG